MQALMTMLANQVGIRGPFFPWEWLAKEQSHRSRGVVASSNKTEKKLNEVTAKEKDLLAKL